MGFTNRRRCAIIDAELNSGKFAGAAARGAVENRERGANPRQDRCCDVERRALSHWIDSEKAARRVETQSEDLPAKRVSNLRPKERYVPEARATAGMPVGGLCLRR